VPAQPAPPAVLVLTTSDADELVLRALQAGAAGFLLKDTPPAEIVRPIERVHAGDGMLSPTVTHRLISTVAGDSDAGARVEHARSLLGTLCPRERDVALAVGRGQGNARARSPCSCRRRASGRRDGPALRPSARRVHDERDAGQADGRAGDVEAVGAGSRRRPSPTAASRR
jgi:CheY-like chemotaxis protein